MSPKKPKPRNRSDYRNKTKPLIVKWGKGSGKLFDI